MVVLTYSLDSMISVVLPSLVFFLDDSMISAWCLRYLSSGGLCQVMLNIILSALTRTCVSGSAANLCQWNFLSLKACPEFLSQFFNLTTLWCRGNKSEKSIVPVLWESLYIYLEFVPWSRTFVVFYYSLYNRWANQGVFWSRGANIYVYGSNLLCVELTCKKKKILFSYWFFKNCNFFFWKQSSSI